MSDLDIFTVPLNLPVQKGQAYMIQWRIYVRLGDLIGFHILGKRTFASEM